ncbi:MAG TPA: putative ABC transporter permease [Candidatus Flavonifractor merdigallinarum]|uniref:ABC transporter permease n=1 Tax=Candidatus Flavonifractor merdigallinarum TaxID=2838589 RepID=A0A9D2BYU1_9FIRM|nr:putative ABC transporter permease [Candidatus Flavonifractor merdigallinarum]
MYNTLYELLWFFLLYSFAGWCAGVIVAALRKHTFVNTGFLTLPFCPIYGVAAVVFSIFLPELRDRLFFLFLAGAVLSAFLVFVTGFVLERIFHRKWWDYTRYRFQFEGYITLPHLIIWGLLAVLCIRVTNPLICSLLSLLPSRIARPALLILLVLVGIDLLVSLISVLQLRLRLRRLTALQEDFRNLSTQFGNAITGRVQRRMMRAYPNLAPEKLLHQGTPAKAVPTVFALGCCFHKLVWLFVIAAFLGDIIETIFCRLTAGVWMSRSSLVWGPFSVVWGLGAVLLTAVLYKYKDKNDRYIFLAGTVLGGVYEYVCSVFTELVFGTIFWDYSHLPFNLGGRINLLFCFFWGIAAVFWLKGAYPLLSRLIERIPIRVGKVGTWVLLAFMVVNMAVSSLALARYTQRHLENPSPTTFLSQLLDERFPDERMEHIYPNAKQVD